MRIEFSLLRTRVARRMLVLFLICAVVPVIVLGGVAYAFVSHSLMNDLTERLHGDGNVAGQLMLGHLQDLASQLKLQPPPGDSSRHQIAILSLERRVPFERVIIEHDDGSVTSTEAPTAGRPVLNEVQQAQLASGRPTLIVQPGDSSRGMYLVVPGTGERQRGYPRTWGYLTVDEALRGLDATRQDGTQLCLDDAHGLLACDAAAPSDRTGILTESRSLFLMREFAAPAWTVVLREPSAETLAPLRWFRRVFLLGLVFAVALVFAVSHAQIRQRMTPLADLEAGTRRLRGGDFSTRVQVQSDDEFESLAASFNQMAAGLEHQFATLSSLHEIDHAALRDRTAGAIAMAALQGLPALLGASAVTLATPGLEDDSPWRVETVAAGERTSRCADVRPSRAEIAELDSIADHSALIEPEAWPSYCESLRRHGCDRYVVFPVQCQHDRFGALAVGLAGRSGVGDQLFGTGRQLADQLALGLSNVSLLNELDAMSLGALTALARTVDAASHWTAGHSERVTTHAVEIARRLGLDSGAITKLRQGGLLHDIGKLGVPATILDKPGALTLDELSVMQSHPAIGASIVKSIPAFRDLVPLVLHHHELLDGSGYPARLSGVEIPELVRILTVADVFDALVSNRPYRHGLEIEIALGILVKDAGTKFDARAVEVLRDMVAGGWASPDETADMSAVTASEAARYAPTAGATMTEYA